MPRPEEDEHDVVPLPNVGLLVLDDRAHLVLIQQLEQPGRNDRHRGDRTGEAVRHGSRGVDEARSRLVRLAQEKKQLRVPAALSLGADDRHEEVEE